jgi:hypothetical protein
MNSASSGWPPQAGTSRLTLYVHLQDKGDLARTLVARPRELAVFNRQENIELVGKPARRSTRPLYAKGDDHRGNLRALQ